MKLKVSESEEEGSLLIPPPISNWQSICGLVGNRAITGIDIFNSLIRLMQIQEKEEALYINGC